MPDLIVKPTQHKTFTHHAAKNTDPTTDPHVKELIVECVFCDWTATGFTRKPEAKAAGVQHETDSNHPSTTSERNHSA